MLGLSGIVGLIISIVLLILLVIGLWYSKRHSFKAGVYFFLILILHEVYSFGSPPLIRNYIDTLILGNSDLMMGMSISQLLVFLSVIPKLIELLAFTILIVGLHDLWKSKNA